MRSPCEWPQSMRLVTKHNRIWDLLIRFLYGLSRPGRGNSFGLVPRSRTSQYSSSCQAGLCASLLACVCVCMTVWGGGSGVCSTEQTILHRTGQQNKQYFTPAKFTAPLASGIPPIKIRHEATRCDKPSQYRLGNGDRAGRLLLTRIATW